MAFNDLTTHTNIADTLIKISTAYISGFVRCPVSVLMYSQATISYVHTKCFLWRRERIFHLMQLYCSPPYRPTTFVFKTRPTSLLLLPNLDEIPIQKGVLSKRKSTTHRKNKPVDHRTHHGVLRCWSRYKHYGD